MTGFLLFASFLALFDGKTLNGWKQCNGSATYAVEAGAITGTTAKGSPNSFLCTEREYGDFVLEFETKTDPALNSGVQIRSHRYPAETAVRTFNGTTTLERKQPAGRVYGYQVEISNQESGASGGIYDEARRGGCITLRAIRTAAPRSATGSGTSTVWRPRATAFVPG